MKCLTLLRIGNFKIELAVLSKGEITLPHTHQLMDKEIVHLWGRATYRRMELDGSNSKKVNVSWKNFGRCYSVKSNQIHYAEPPNGTVVFLLLEFWKTTPQSELTSLEIV